MPIPALAVPNAAPIAVWQPHEMKLQEAVPSRNLNLHPKIIFRFVSVVHHLRSWIPEGRIYSRRKQSLPVCEFQRHVHQGISTALTIPKKGANVGVSSLGAITKIDDAEGLLRAVWSGGLGRDDRRGSRSPQTKLRVK